MDHDTGFAPHVERGVCTLCGCKTTTVESWAKPGGWVIGIGGNGTGKPDDLIYAMEVESNKSVKEHSPNVVGYLRGHGIAPTAKVLLSRHFYYFGKCAIPVPRALREALTIPAQG